VVQLAHSAGAKVVATGRAWAENLVQEPGADDFVDVERDRFEDAVQT
jgi:NADPH:quinone reductase-like Zn-dependent oxidoreductase